MSGQPRTIQTRTSELKKQSLEQRESLLKMDAENKEALRIIPLVDQCIAMADRILENLATLSPNDKRELQDIKKYYNVLKTYVQQNKGSVRKLEIANSKGESSGSVYSSEKKKFKFRIPTLTYRGSRNTGSSKQTAEVEYEAPSVDQSNGGSGYAGSTKEDKQYEPPSVATNDDDADTIMIAPGLHVPQYDEDDTEAYYHAEPIRSSFESSTTTATTTTIQVTQTTTTAVETSAVITTTTEIQTTQLTTDILSTTLVSSTELPTTTVAPTPTTQEPTTTVAPTTEVPTTTDTTTPETTTTAVITSDLPTTTPSSTFTETPSSTPDPTTSNEIPTSQTPDIPEWVPQPTGGDGPPPPPIETTTIAASTETVEPTTTLLAETTSLIPTETVAVKSFEDESSLNASNKDNNSQAMNYVYGSLGAFVLVAIIAVLFFKRRKRREEIQLVSSAWI